VSAIVVERRGLRGALDRAALRAASTCFFDAMFRTSDVRKIFMSDYPMNGGRESGSGSGGIDGGDSGELPRMGIALRLPAVPTSIGQIRRAVEGVARGCGLDDDVVGDVRLAVSEAATNAIVHGNRGHGEVEVRACESHGELVITISDDGQGMRPRADSPGMGLGLPLIAAVSDRFDIVSDRRGTRLMIVFPCPGGIAA
jgi:anti-sigma regulatory factor (Ser/Thr protein kinase)